MPKAIDLEEIIAEVRAHLDAGGARFAAFDADGTLWDADVGEVVFEAGRELIDDETLLGPVREWARRWDLDLEGSADQAWDKLQAFALQEGLGDGTADVSDQLLVELYAMESWVFAGRSEAELTAHTEALFAAGLADAIFDEVKQLVDALGELDVEVLVLSGSLRGAVLAGTRRLGIDDDRVFGTEPGRDASGYYLPEAVTMFGPEKGARLDLLSGGREVAASFGDSPSGNDKQLLSRARLPVAMNPKGKHRDYARDKAMRAWWIK